MKTMKTAFMVVLLIHLLLLVCFGGWLHTTGRLNGDRLQAAVDLFTPTIEEEETVKAEAEKKKQAEMDQVREMERLGEIEKGSTQLRQRLAELTMSDEIALQRFERMKREIKDLHGSIEKARQLLEKQREQLDVDKAAFESQLAQEKRKREDEGFKNAVKLIEQLKPKQAKELFKNLIAQQQTDQVIRYLAAMNLRKAASVLKEFKEPIELTMATDLIERLRKRGVSLLSGS